MEPTITPEADPVAKDVYEYVTKNSPNAWEQVRQYVYCDHADLKRLNTTEIVDLIYLSSALNLDRLVILGLNVYMKTYQVKELPSIVKNFWKHKSKKKISIVQERFC